MVPEEDSRTDAAALVFLAVAVEAASELARHVSGRLDEMMLRLYADGPREATEEECLFPPQDWMELFLASRVAVLEAVAAGDPTA